MLVQPQVYLLGFTTINADGLASYLEDTNQLDFSEDVKKAKEQGLSDAEILCSFYAKLCYKSLVVGHNANISKVREIQDNIIGTIAQGHGSVFEHASVNFVATNVSRILTHELVRQRAGWAYSQTSGRYCRLDNIDVVFDSILKGCESNIRLAMSSIEHAIYFMECKTKLRVPPKQYPNSLMEDWLLTESEIEQMHGPFVAATALKWVPNPNMPMMQKKKLTSAIRRIAPNGQSNEIGFTINFRALRHFLMLRSSRHAEWEIRCVAHQVYNLVEPYFPLLFEDATINTVDGFYEITDMKMQPYEADFNSVLEQIETDVLEEELAKRKA